MWPSPPRRHQLPGMFASHKLKRGHTICQHIPARRATSGRKTTETAHKLLVPNRYRPPYTQTHTPVAFNYRHSLGRRLRRPAPSFCQHSKVSPSLLITSSKFFFSFVSFVLRLVCAYTCTSVYLYVRRKQNQTFRTEFMKVAD